MYQQQLNGAGRPDGATGPPGPPLEERLGMMALGSNDAAGHYAASPSSVQSAGAPPSGYGLASPGPLGAGGPNGPPAAAAAMPGQPQPPTSPKSARKRPNQAQRRQMSAQLSIPVDPRPHPPHAAGSYASPPGYGNHHQFPHAHPFQRGSHQQQAYGQFHQSQHSFSQHPHAAQRPQSATLRPAHYGNGPMPLTGQGSGGPPLHPSQPRHQQSLSYQGPALHDDPFNWRSHPSHQPSPGSFDAPSPRGARSHSIQNAGRHYHTRAEDIQMQASLLETLCEQIVARAEIEPVEIQEKERFRAHIERLCQDALAKYELEANSRPDFPAHSVRLKCFGSLSSGFATKASDMDLGLISPLSLPQPDAPKSPIPRIIEKAFLDAGLGARLLSRTRVPIIKLCETPPKQLQLDLLEERAKWERGLLPDHDGPDAEDDEGPDTAQTQDHSKADHARKESVLDDEPLGGERYMQALATLKQQDSQSIGNYYATAKRVLRKLGGRDITHSTAREFTDREFKILTDVCHAFVEGLADTKLQSRLWATRSLAAARSPTQHSYRSLYGVYTQVEGETLAMLWEARDLPEKDKHHEDDALAKVRFWKDLQNKPTFYQDLLGYNKELQGAVENLRRVPSLQVMTLEQGQFEPPSQYHERATRLLVQSGGRDTASPGNTALAVVIRHYIAGIWSPEIREQVGLFSQTMDKPSLRAVARRHKSLQLASEFEKALAKRCYEGRDAEVAQAYVDILRAPLQKCDLPGRRFDYVVARTPETAPVISLARRLADPSKLAPNQPRDPYKDRLEFPKTGTGVQCDINFSAHLALQNSLLLRCYAHTDARVRPLVLFVKHWAKMRDINTPYRGTLSSYGYVLMVLHYLVNIAQPFVCPNLQLLAKPVPEGLSPEAIEETVTCRGRDVRFWRDEDEIRDLASKGLLTQNQDTTGYLLRGFFEYYAQSNFMSTVPCRGFDWGRDVLSLRTQGGLRSKQSKGWTGARTVLEVQNQATAPPPPPPPPPPDGAVPEKAGGATDEAQPSPGAAGDGPTTPVAAPDKAVELKEVKHRFLFAIEDPFELEHNVARTVTHSGIVAIRDEFRRAWRIIKNLGKAADEGLLDSSTDQKPKDRDLFGELLTEIHGPELTLRPTVG